MCSGCTTDGLSADSSKSPAALTVASLAGQWEEAGPLGDNVPPAVASTNLIFAPKILTVTVGCNTLSFGYVVDGSAVHIRSGSMTQVNCLADQLDAEAWLFETLVNATLVSADDTGAVLTLQPSGLQFRRSPVVSSPSA